jgi:hypothetical protein
MRSGASSHLIRLPAGGGIILWAPSLTDRSAGRGVDTTSAAAGPSRSQRVAGAAGSIEDFIDRLEQEEQTEGVDADAVPDW